MVLTAEISLRRPIPERRVEMSIIIKLSIGFYINYRHYCGTLGYHITLHRNYL